MGISNKMIHADLVYYGKLNAKNGVGSVIRQIHSNIDVLKNNGIDVSFHCLQNQIDTSASNHSSSRIRISYRRLFIQIARRNYILSRIAAFRLIFFNAKKSVSNYLKQHRDPELIWFHDIFTCFYYCTSNSFNINTKILLVNHGNGETFKMLLNEFPKLNRNSFYKKLDHITDVVFRNTNQFVFVSKYSVQNFSRLNPSIDQSKITSIYNGISDVAYNKKVVNRIHGYNLCCVATINHRKGQNLIVEAMHQLADNNLKDEIQITFLGDGSERLSLEEKVEKYGLSSNFQFLGNVTNVFDYLEAADIFILASYDEGLPIAIIEAMRSSLPIISTKVGGIPEMVQHELNGLLINPDVTEIVKIFENIEIYNWEEMGKKSRIAYLEDFTDLQMTNNYARIINKIVDNHS